MILRSVLFNVAFYAWTIFMCLAHLPIVLGPGRWTVAAQRRWARHIVWLMDKLANITVEIRGREHLPEGAVIVAAKHQSTWDTLIYHLVLDDPAIVLKKELLYIPVYGWFGLKADMIAVDRKAGLSAMRQLIRSGEKARDKGRPILIFPEGTRTEPGTSRPYQPGVAGLYRELGVSVVPVAVNSGYFWPRRKFLRRPGRLVLEFLEPIAPGMERKAFTAELAVRIETASVRLLEEAMAGGEASPESRATAPKTAAE